MVNGYASKGVGQHLDISLVVAANGRRTLEFYDRIELIPGVPVSSRMNYME